MSDVTITVRGEHERRLAPERATIRVSVRTEGADRAPVVDGALRLAEPVRQSIIARSDAGSVSEWSSKNLSVRAERPWSGDGRRLDPVYYASVDVAATFVEASELSTWVSEISAWDGVEVGGVEWHLTSETLARVEREVASAAVGVAVDRAQAYASALGRSEVVPVELADVGLIAPGHEASGAPLLKARGGVAFAADAGASMQYEPEDIVITATVEARFLAR